MLNKSLLFLLPFDRYAEYERKRYAFADSTQAAISQFLQCRPQEANHPRQKAITHSIVADLVVGCSMPLSITENWHFRHFMSVADSRYQPVLPATGLKDIIQQNGFWKPLIPSVTNMASEKSLTLLFVTMLQI